MARHSDLVARTILIFQINHLLNFKQKKDAKIASFLASLKLVTIGKVIPLVPAADNL